VQDPQSSMPPHDYRVSRGLRLLVFSFVAAALVVSAFVVSFRWIWDSFLAEPLGRGAYEARAEILVPSILILTLLIAYWLRESSIRIGARDGRR
jgi:hypothetical protein